MEMMPIFLLLIVPVQAELLQGGCDLEHQLKALVGLVRRQRQDLVFDAVVRKVLQRTTLPCLFECFKSCAATLASLTHSQQHLETVIDVPRGPYRFNLLAVQPVYIVIHDDEAPLADLLRWLCCQLAGEGPGHHAPQQSLPATSMRCVSMSNGVAAPGGNTQCRCSAADIQRSLPSTSACSTTSAQQRLPDDCNSHLVVEIQQARNLVDGVADRLRRHHLERALQTDTKDTSSCMALRLTMQ
jgi:hypothetical protein